MSWSVDQIRKTYSIPHWADGYFDVDDQGRVVVCPQRQAGRRLLLTDIVDAACASGARLPVLLRFPEILIDRLIQLKQAFAAAQQEYHYQGGYTAIYPIKVNQHYGVAGQLAAQLDEGLGLEAGSKPELMAVLALSRQGGTIVCNGYKDREYIHLALVGRKLGLNTIIVIEKPSELQTILQEAEKLNIQPSLGVRMRLASLGAGKWQNSGGDKAKFGLSPGQVLAMWNTLQQTSYAPCLNLIHFHMGSQISNLRDIANGMREATRYFVELSRSGACIQYVDVGGGLGVDYEGTRSRSECSINYSIATYANRIMQPLAEACHTNQIAQPRVLTECGRAMTAHHAILVTNVVDVETAPQGCIPAIADQEPLVIRHLREIYDKLDERPAVELFYEAQHNYSEGLAAYILGQINLWYRAHLDDLFYAIAHQIRRRLSFDDRNHRDILDELNQRLVDKYFVNFSIFESMPDVWAINQIFPIMPIDQLEQLPTRQGIIADMTCDSDGVIKTYVQQENLSSTLPLHRVRNGQLYRIAFFLVGAYQEILGDIHNLFGDTDAVAVCTSDDGFRLTQQRLGDTTDALLDYIGYPLEDIRQRFEQLILSANLGEEQSQQLQQSLAAGLGSYPYLSGQ